MRKRLEDKEYATTKIVMIDPKILKETNIVDIFLVMKNKGTGSGNEWLLGLNEKYLLTLSYTFWMQSRKASKYCSNYGR